jgi:hypothetical protein
MSIRRVLTTCVLTLLAGCGTPSDAPRKNTPSKADTATESPAKSPLQEGGPWLDAQGQEIKDGDLKLRIDAAEIAPVKLQAKAGEGEFAPTAEKYLIVRLTLTNVGEKRKLEYIGWGSFAAQLGGNSPTLTDEQRRTYKLVTFGQEAAVEGRLNSVNLVQGQGKQDLIVFQAPPADVSTLFLTLPGENVGGKEPIRLRIRLAK